MANCRLWGLLSKGTKSRAVFTHNGKGRAGYRSPEVLKDPDMSYNQKLLVDIWSLDCIMCELSMDKRAFWKALQFSFEERLLDIVIVGVSGPQYSELQNECQKHCTPIPKGGRRRAYCNAGWPTLLNGWITLCGHLKIKFILHVTLRQNRRISKILGNSSESILAPHIVELVMGMSVI